ncbi:3-isopropylmalate dehydratase small subunit [Noviherbaspirillum malthae]|jgi:3-isopropylmalate/(R)-2-methylmalate dehydratase small subunit|uniref:3-isopropylmalate dehydratase small subunit n=1 Tax=Noviherbaspirillum malthae TaxID=1260987 RepID=UPI00188E8968|nr:3-isopropylmalate dehydratase small subunit [Noviherbaspirillum malthae]
MDKFETLTGLAAPLDRDNVDTDAIIPKQFMKSVARTGFGLNLFDAWRYTDIGEPGMDNAARPHNPDFVLNQSRYHGASILLVRRNFGCGSSREHAPWAISQYGFRVLIGISFADIFRQNCYKNGILAITLPERQVDALFAAAVATPGYRLKVDLPLQTVADEAGRIYPFEIAPFIKHNLVNGLDEIGLTLQHQEAIRTFEQQRHARCPWLAVPVDAGPDGS